MISTVLTILLIITAFVLLILVTVFQHGNEGGIGTAFGAGNSAGFFGASGGVNVIVKATWICGVLFFGLSTGLAWVKTHESFGVSREIDSVLDDPDLLDLDQVDEEKPNAEEMDISKSGEGEVEEGSEAPSAEQGEAPSENSQQEPLEESGNMESPDSGTLPPSAEPSTEK